MINLDAMLTALRNGTQIPFALYGWQTNPAEDAWGILTLDGQEAAIWSDDRMEAQAVRGHVSVFCRTLGGIPDAVQTVLDGLGVSWTFETTDYEPDTRLLHYTWAWREWGDL